jgi:hypothetical protein
LRSIASRVSGPLRWVVLSLGLALGADSAAAQDATDADAAAPEPRSAASLALVSTVRTGPVTVDGRIDEEAWALAPVASGFVQAEPNEGQPAQLDSEVRVLVDEEAIYVSARMWDPDPSKISKLLMRRDERGPFFDWFGFTLDPNLDRRTGYGFRVSASGQQADYFIADDSFEDFAWSSVWQSAVATDSLGWTAELRIPLSQIRYTSVEGARTWGVNFTRRTARLVEMSHYAFTSRRREEGIASRFTTLENVIVPRSVRRIEARPYVLSGLHNGPAEEGDPFFDGSASSARFGSDFRLGLGSAFTLDATVNPDFGQVDADPAEINLSDFETFLQERRPFFVEDGQIFDFRLTGGQNKLFHSRRIGRAPSGSAPNDADFVDVPDAATILGAAKLTGRTAGGLAMGVLASMTAAETGTAFYSTNGEKTAFDAEPAAQYGVLTAQQDFNGGTSQIGVLATAFRRDLPANGTLDFLTDQAFNAGVRWDHQWGNRGWRLTGFLAGSHVRGSPEALLRIQTASNHYFQRPDATRAEIDSTATSISGREWRVQVERQNTEHWTASLSLAEVSQGFEVNDMGFSGNRERLDGSVRVGYRNDRPGTLFRDYNLNFQTFWNFSHEVFDDAFSWDSWRRGYTNGQFNLSSRATFLNFHGVDMNVTYRPDQYSRNATRGGPIMLMPGQQSLRFGFNSDRRRSVSVNTGFNVSRSAHDAGQDFSIDAGLGLRPSSQLTIDVQPRFSVQTEGSQYVGSTSTLAYQPTYGRRYLFGELERKTFSLETRVDYTFSPSLSFQLYAQPLISSGEYVAYKQLASAGTYDFVAFQQGQATTTDGTVACTGGTICRTGDRRQYVDFDGDGRTDYNFSDRNFNVRSLIGNAVLRWEYRPGSTVFLVWQRQQEGDGVTGDFDFGRDVDALWGAPADNRFIIKVNYWLGL